MKARWFFLVLMVLVGFVAQAQNTFTQEDRGRLIRLETRMDEMQKQIDFCFEAVDNRFEDINSRLDQ